MAKAESDLRIAVSIKTLGLAIASYTDVYSNIIQNMKGKNISIDRQVGEATGKIFGKDKKDFDEFISKLKNTSFDAAELLEAEKDENEKITKPVEEVKDEFLGKISERIEAITEAYAFLGDVGRKENRIKNITKDLTNISNELSKVFNKAKKQNDEVNSQVIALGREIARDLDKIILRKDLTEINIPIPLEYSAKVKYKPKGLVRGKYDRPIDDKFTIGDILSNPILRLQEALDESIDESIQKLKDEEKEKKGVNNSSKIKELEEAKKKGPEWLSIFSKAGITDKEGHFTEKFIDDVEDILMIDIDEMVDDLVKLLDTSYAFKEFAKGEEKVSAIKAGLRFDTRKKQFAYKEFKKIIDEMYSKYKDKHSELKKSVKDLEKELKLTLDFGQGKIVGGKRTKTEEMKEGYKRYKAITSDKNAKKFYDAAKANDKKKIISLLTGQGSPFKGSLKRLKTLSRYSIVVKLGKDRDGNPKYSFTEYKQFTVIEAETRLLPRGKGSGKDFRPIRQPKIGVSKFKRAQKGEFAIFMDSVKAGIKELEDELQEMI